MQKCIIWQRKRQQNARQNAEQSELFRASVAFSSFSSGTAAFDVAALCGAYRLRFYILALFETSDVKRSICSTDCKTHGTPYLTCRFSHTHTHKERRSCTGTMHYRTSGTNRVLFFLRPIPVAWDRSTKLFDASIPRH